MTVSRIQGKIDGKEFSMGLNSYSYQETADNMTLDLPSYNSASGYVDNLNGDIPSILYLVIRIVYH